MALIPVGGVSKHRIAHLAVAADIFLHLSAYECAAFDPSRHKKSCPSLTDSDPCFAEKEGLMTLIPVREYQNNGSQPCCRCGYFFTPVRL